MKNIYEICLVAFTDPFEFRATLYPERGQGGYDTGHGGRAHG
jgi:hypothetical protein